MEIDEKKETTVKELSKSQSIRLVDVFLIAPFLFYIGYKSKGLKKVERGMVYLIAAATLYYNGKNYLINKKSKNYEL
tara:strand:+ start:1734 stop:1964 length:231 start_codon:yes stop_codon:yes gene_type:complete